jgi:hypothetical protein
MIVHGIIVILYFTALGFNIWGRGIDHLFEKYKKGLFRLCSM